MNDKSQSHRAQRTVLPIHDSQSLDEACGKVLESARAAFDELASTPISDVSPATVLDRWDDIEILIEDVFGPVSLFNEVHTDRKVRTVADGRMIELATFTTEIYQNRELYERVRAVEPETPAQEMLKKDLLEAFEDSGVALDEEARQRFRTISQKISELSQQFASNIREQSPRVRFSRSEVEGLPAGVLDVLETDGDDVLVAMDYPQYNPFMMTVHSGDARERLFKAYLQRGGTDNLRLLDEITRLRSEIANLYGLPTYAHYVTRRRMVGDPETVATFLDNVMGAVREREQKDLQTLRKAKAQREETSEEETTIERWDVAYWSERVREERFDIDQEELRRYFPTQPSVEWTLRVSERLYGVRFQKADVPVWHPDVIYYDVIDDDDAFLGGIYLDLYPRDGKYKHAAAWPVRGVSRRTGRRPISVLVTNFDRQGLTHHELETLLHEFGHVLHGVLSATWYSMHSGTAVQRDFVEAPSQMFEEWGRRLESLSLIKEMFPDSPEIDADLVKRLDAARRFGKGIHYARQHLYASYDMALAGAAPGGSLERWRLMEQETPLGYVEDTYFPAGFGHITGGYAAGYYGYLWSETIAIDLLSEFGDDIMDATTGRRFRNEILARGGEIPARDLVETFLGREVSSEAFIRELRGE